MTTKKTFLETAERLGVEIEETPPTPMHEERGFGAYAPERKRFDATDTHFINLGEYWPGDRPNWAVMIEEISGLHDCDRDTCECECWESN